jgi:hypothetical protein
MLFGEKHPLLRGAEMHAAGTAELTAELPPLVTAVMAIFVLNLFLVLTLYKLGWTVRKQRQVDKMCSNAKARGFFSQDSYDEHEEFFRNYLCATPTKGPLSETGFDFIVLYDIYCHYRGVLHMGEANEMKVFAWMYLGYRYLHLYPTYDNIGLVLWTPLLGCISERYYREHIKPRMVLLGNAIFETVWDDLYLPENIIDNKPNTTGSLDGSPVYAWKPSSTRVASMLIAPKYGKNAVFKFQIVVTNMFRIAHEWGLDIGVDHDAKMCRASGVLNLRQWWEYWFGDLGYQGLPG